MRRWLLAALMVVVMPAAWAQSTSSAPVTQPGWELPAGVRADLGTIEDFAFNFDQAGFYAVLEFVARSPHSPGHRQQPVVVADWRSLLERPSDFRGRPITVEGVVGRNTSFRLLSHPGLGDLSQLELSRPDQPLACTVIFTQPADDVPLGASITVTGYFVMIRQYYDSRNMPRQAVLLVSPGPTTIGQAVSVRDATGFQWGWMIAAVLAGVVITIVLIRWSTTSGRHGRQTLRARREAPMDLSEDLAELADEQDESSGRPT